jgi:hypothetical protein
MKKLILILCTATLFACSNDEDLTTPSSSENKQLIGNTYEEQGNGKALWQFTKDSISITVSKKNMVRKYYIQNDSLFMIQDSDVVGWGKMVIDDYGFKLYDDAVRTFIKL